MDHLVLLLLLWSSGLQAEGQHTSTEPDDVRLVGGASRCAGTLELKHQGDWRPVSSLDWTLKAAAVVCRELDCGSAVSVGERKESSDRPVWEIRSDCVQSGSALRECVTSCLSSSILDVTCSDSVRLLDGTSLCSGRLEVKSNQRWSSVCEADFDQQDAEVVCRELGCGAPSVLQGALYGEVEAPMWTKEFQCGGHESALLDCRSSGSARNTCSPGKAVGLTCSEPVRLVGGASPCSGTLEVKQGDWRPVRESFWTLKTAAVVCRDLDCGSAVSVGQRKESSVRPVWWIRSDCVQSGSALRECVTSTSSSFILDLTCSDSVRLVNGTSLCSGRLEVKSNQSNQSNQRWSSVCEADFDQQDAEVVCRELGCGAPSVLQGALYGEVEAPMWTKEFQCGGHESALLDCRSSGSARNTCSPGKAVGLTCSEPVRLVGGASRCAGTLELKHQGDWRPVSYIDWTLKEAAVVCRQLDCGSAVSVGEREESSRRPQWWIRSDCVQSGSALRECASSSLYSSILYLTCSDSVRLLDGTSLCSGRLEVKSNQSNQSNQRWSSVCEADFDQQDAEVVCRELGCGAPSVLQGALYGEVEAPMWTKEFQCGGHESALLDCRSSGSARNTCSPGKAVGLTCSEPDDVRLVGGASRCAGTLELKHQGDWRPVSYFDSDWTLKTAGVVCRDLDCGSAVSVGKRKESSDRPVWSINSDCVQSGSALRECSESFSFSSILDLTCTDSVRLLDGTSLCSGRLEVKSNQSNQSNQRWSSVCEADFDQQDAEVVCRELGCGAPSVLQGALYGEVEAPMWTKEFQCGGHESALLDCRSSGSARNTCSPGKAVGLTCSEPDNVRLVGGASRCAGTLELKHQRDWRPVRYSDWTQKAADVACRKLDCGSAVSVEEREESSVRPVWWIRSDCVQSGSALRECVRSFSSSSILDLTCSDLLLQPNISVSSFRVRVSEAHQQGFQVSRGSTLNISCSIQPQYPGGSFQLAFTSSNASQIYTQRAVNHSAHFLFLAAEPAHQGNYSCVYHVHVFSHDFSSESRRLSLTVSDSVRLLDGTSLCSGRLEVKSNQRWSSVCEADFDQQDAEVVCRELGCGAPSVLQGALYGEVEAPMWTKEFQCGGHESALLDCRSSGSARNTCSPGKAVGLTCSEPDDVRLVGGASRCAGTLELKHQGDWRPMRYSDWTLKEAAVVCRDLGCGSAVSVGERKESSVRPVWWISSDCVQSGSALRECATSFSSSSILDLTCSDSVRLLDGTSLCSGRLEVKSNQRWSSVCEADFDQQDAEVVCRELGCGAPSVLQGALYGEVEAPMWTKEFQCGGHESALLDCRSSGSARNTCSPGKAVGLTCSEPDDVRLVGGASRCAGTLELKHQGDWRPVMDSVWTLKKADVVCRDLDCGSAVSVGERKESSDRPVWWIRSDCGQSGSALRECVESGSSSSILDVTCSDSVRLVNGTSLCSGRLEVKSNQSNQSNQRWSSVCEADFDQQDAEVVCRELGCGAPSVLQGALYGEVEAPMWTKEFQCGGHESALLDCRSSGSARNTCSPGKAVGLTCSEADDVRLVGGASRCAGTLELKQGDWRPMRYSVSFWTLKEAAVVCRDLDCGSAVSVGERKESSVRPVWWIRSDCVQSGSALRECVESTSSSFILDLTCSDSVRLLDGTSLCSGRLEVKSNQSNQSNQRWSSVCEADFDQQDAEVVCRELGCGAPSGLQGVLYGEVEAPMWTKEFQCGGHESALLDCRSSGSARNTCSPGKAVGLTCSEPDDVRLVGGASRCAGTLELKHQGVWRPVINSASIWTRKEAAVVCRKLDCGSAVSVGERKESSDRPVWRIRSDCVQSESSLRECVKSDYFSFILDLTCSDISVSSSVDGVSEAQQQGFQVSRGSTFNISCSIQPQYPGGSFQLAFTSSNASHNYTQPAVNHSAHFLFPAAEPAHQGSYICVYHFHVFSHDFSSESRRLSLTVSDCAAPSDSDSTAGGGASDSVRPKNGTSMSNSDSVRPKNETSLSNSDSVRPKNETSLSNSDSVRPKNETSLSNSGSVRPKNETSLSNSDSVRPKNETSLSNSDSVRPKNETSLSNSDPTVHLIIVLVRPLTLQLVLLFVLVWMLMTAALCFYYKACRGQKLGSQENIVLDQYTQRVSAAD
ncbi:scavenger receptor cysteine-rich type 1 protein M160-like [Micropterus salmoides]|uniref:scavenger receptor cysteine-rich type 1 protein M160-like n=1 Tax=Micropterus salmoides TaxID=27706 RepID=UPI0018EC4F3F|nr:scavenger receptor cysteine-rich type 1 protein M160-like [Micropterus salmoides]